MHEGSNRSRVTHIAVGSARDLFEAGLNEAAWYRPSPMGVRDERRRLDDTRCSVGMTEVQAKTDDEQIGDRAVGNDRVLAGSGKKARACT